MNGEPSNAPIGSQRARHDWATELKWINVKGSLGGLVLKNMSANAGDAGSIPGSGRCPGKINANPIPHSCLGNPKDRGAWQAVVHGVAKELNTT